MYAFQCVCVVGYGGGARVAYGNNWRLSWAVGEWRGWSTGYRDRNGASAANRGRLVLRDHPGTVYTGTAAVVVFLIFILFLWTHTRTTTHMRTRFVVGAEIPYSVAHSIRWTVYFCLSVNHISRLRNSRRPTRPREQPKTTTGSYRNFDKTTNVTNALLVCFLLLQALNPL